MGVISAFEIIAETLVPDKILPPGAENPFLIQGFWLQISAPGLADSDTAQFNIVFTETTGFTQGEGQDALQAQYIDATGTVQPYDQFFASTANGFLDQTIAGGQTLIYGVQCIPGLSPAAIEQGGTGWRGTVAIDPQIDGVLIATPTQRQVYYRSSNFIGTPVLNATVSSVLTFNGTIQV